MDITVVTEFYNKYSKGQATFRPVILHFKGGGSPCYMFSPMPAVNTVGGLCCIMLRGGTGDDVCYLKTPLGPESVEKLAAMHTINEDGKQMLRVISAAIAYKICFPDAFVDGIPEDLRHPSQCKKIRPKSSTIHIPHVAKDSKYRVDPHYRCGGFITFRDDRYVNMKGQTIFRKGGYSKHTDTARDENRIRVLFDTAATATRHT